MIISKAALGVAVVAAKDSAVPMLGYVRFETDGSIIAAARNMIVVVGPVPEEVRKEVPLYRRETPVSAGFCITGETVKKVSTAIGVDKLFGGRLEFADVTAPDSQGRCIFTLHDGRREQKIEARARIEKEWVPWRDIVKEALSGRRGTLAVEGERTILNRVRLRMMLDVIDKAAPDRGGGESPAYLEFTGKDDIIVRSVNYVTGQRVIGVMTSYKGGVGVWLKESDWERRLYAVAKRERISTGGDLQGNGGTALAVNRVV